MISSTPKTLTASGAIKTGNGQIAAVCLAAGSDTATVTLYDNTSGSGSILAKLTATANTTATLSIPCPAVFSNCYAAITGTGPTVTVYHL